MVPSVRDRGLLARLGSLALVGVGVVVCPLVAGLEFSHVHAHGARTLAHRHPHAGGHRHPATDHHGPANPERRDEDGRHGFDPVVSLSDGAPLLPGAITVGVDRQLAARPAPPARRALRPLDIRSHRVPRAPPG